MADTITTSAREFAGFVDGFRARNLASIQQKTRVQLSEMETRLSILRNENADPKFQDVNLLLNGIEKAFRNQEMSIIDRLLEVAKCIVKLITSHSDFLSRQPQFHSHLKAFSYAYIEAAEASGSDELFDAAANLARIYTSTFSVLDT